MTCYIILVEKIEDIVYNIWYSRWDVSKKFIIFTLILSLCLVFTGCANVTTSVNWINGAIVEEINIQLDKDIIIHHGYNYEGIVADLYEVKNDKPSGLLWDWLQEAKSNYVSKVYSVFAGNDEKIIEYLNFGLIDSGISPTSDGFTLYLTFSHFDYFMFFNNMELKPGQTHIIDVPFNGEVTKQDDDLTSAYIQTSTTLFAGCLEKTVNGVNIVDKIKDIFASNLYVATPIEFDVSEVDLTYKFITPYRRLHSDGKVSKIDNKYEHTWQIDILDSDQEIHFYRVSANSIVWYLGALGITVLFLVIGTVVAVIIERKKRRKL